MRWVFMLALVGCGEVASVEGLVEGGADGAPVCVTDKDCPSGEECLYLIADGCGARARCVVGNERCGHPTFIGCGCDDRPDPAGCDPRYARAPLASPNACATGTCAVYRWGA